MRSTASGSQRNTPSTGSRMRASASSRVKAASSISSKKLYQGLPSLVQMRLMPTPLITATRCSENVFMKMLRARCDTRCELLARVPIASLRHPILLARGAALELLDHALQVVAEVAAVVGLALLRAEAQHLPGGRRGRQRLHHVGHERVEEVALGDALEVGEHGEEAVLAALVRLQLL